MDAHIAAQVGVDLAEEGHKSVVFGEGLEAFPGHEGEDLDRVVLGPVPQVRVHPAEDVPGAVVPGPSQVERQFLKGGQRLGQPCPDSEAPEGFHLGPTYQGVGAPHPASASHPVSRGPAAQ